MSPGGKAGRLVESGRGSLTIGDQCELIGVARSTYYYSSTKDTGDDERLRQAILRIYEKYPFYGVRRMLATLRRDGFGAGEKRVRRLLRQMGLNAVGPKRSLSKPAPGHEKHPYLLRNLDITRPNQVWATDITYIKLDGGFVYLAAVIDWFSRRILAWEWSNTLDAGFCVGALREAAAINGAPAIFNTDQGSQFTSSEFLKAVKSLGARISMDGKGRATDNALIERFWRSIKYEDILLKDYQTLKLLRKGVAEYVRFYNQERPHQSLDYQTPDQVYKQGMTEKTA
jgi:putative transposase